jgi:hypothetical protein
MTIQEAQKLSCLLTELGVKGPTKVTIEVDAYIKLCMEVSSVMPKDQFMHITDWRCDIFIMGNLFVVPAKPYYDWSA